VTIKLALAVPRSWFPSLLAIGAFLSPILGADILWVVVAGIGIAIIIFAIIH
jgi:hypothetical protein